MIALLNRFTQTESLSGFFYPLDFFRVIRHIRIYSYINDRSQIGIDPISYISKIISSKSVKGSPSDNEYVFCQLLGDSFILNPKAKINCSGSWVYVYSFLNTDRVCTHYKHVLNKIAETMDSKDSVPIGFSGMILSMYHKDYYMSYFDSGILFENGLKGFSKNYKMALYSYLKASEFMPEVNNELGLIYAEGRGINKDYIVAEYWFRKGADQGVASAQHNLASLYEKYNNYESAFEWYLKAANQGYALSQQQIGSMYEFGVGVEKDISKAVYWYRRAADQGDARAQYNLGNIFEMGEGLDKNLALQDFPW